MSDDGLEDFTAEIADQVRSFVIAVRETALGENPDQTVPLLLLEVSQLMLGLSDNPVILLLLINLLLLLVGTFMDMTPAVLIFTPIFWPVAPTCV